MTMESSVIPIKEQTNSLHRLREVCSAFDGEELDEKLLEVMRLMLLAKMLADTLIESPRII